MLALGFVFILKAFIRYVGLQKEETYKTLNQPLDKAVSNFSSET